MPSAPGGRWKNVSAAQVESWGFLVDRRAYPWVAYKGFRAAPTEWHWIKTDEEIAERKLRQKNSREAARRQQQQQQRATEEPRDPFAVLEERIARLEERIAGIEGSL